MNSKDRRKEKRSSANAQASEKHRLANALAARQAHYETEALADFEKFVSEVDTDVELSFWTSYYETGAHKHEAHLFPEARWSSRARKMERGATAGGACPVCRFKFMVAPVVFKRALSFYMASSCQWHQIVSKYAPALTVTAWNVVHPLNTYDPELPVELALRQDDIDLSADCAAKQHAARPKKIWVDYKK